VKAVKAVVSLRAKTLDAVDKGIEVRRVRPSAFLPLSTAQRDTFSSETTSNARADLFPAIATREIRRPHQ
jgi:hypothetical protein